MSGSDIIEGLKQAARGDLARVTLFEDGKQQVWVRDTAFSRLAENTRLTARIAELEKALKPFADQCDATIERMCGEIIISIDAKVDELRFARTTLEASEREEK